MLNVFSVPIFFILLRETLEASIIISVMVALIDKLAETSVRFRDLAGPLRRRVWLGTLSGLLLSLAIGAAFLAVWYKYAVNLWAKAEVLWEGIFGMISVLMVGVTAIAMLKSSRLYEKFALMLARKLGAGVPDPSTVTPAGTAAGSANHDAASTKQASKFTRTVAMIKNLSPLNAVTTRSDDSLHSRSTGNGADHQMSAITRPLKALFWLPFVTILREGLEVVVFIGGVSLGEPASAIPVSAAAGLLAGVVIGLIVHRSGTVMSMHWLFVVFSYVLLMIAAGLLARSIGNLEDYVWGNAINLIANEVGTGSFDPRRSVWHFDCCSPEDNASGWGIFNALLGWRNNATIATITGYCLFWIVATGALVVLRFKENRKRLVRAKIFIELQAAHSEYV
ncbi:high-affinity iron permease [Polyrhizophydium stewartii]|uniref:High-affinity iron permease n=1 Tax=Polyrhizophydium stewartii TaxID=2732419 RepID=A0ABR4N3X8_9FUNG